MNENIFDPYGDFVETKFFLNEYNILPSLLNLDLPLEETAENMEKVLGEITKKGDSEIIIERWKVSKNKDDLESKDFRNYFFLKVPDKSICVHIELSNENLSINFWFDRKNSHSTNWVMDSYKKVRDMVGTLASPTFRVLAKGGGDFYAEEIHIQNTKTDVATNYNKDFIEIDSIINESLKLDRSGLILLHGKPGTGKTTYIKNLLTIHNDKNFIFIPNDFINELLQPEFISFLLSHKNSILVIEDAEKVISSREKINRDSVVSTILQLTDGLFSDYLNIKVICTFNTSINNIDKALLRKGRMIAFYEFKELSLEKTNDLLSSLNQEKSEKELTIAEIYYAKSMDFQQEEESIGFKNS